MAEKTDHADQREKAQQLMNPNTSKLLEQEMVNFLFEAKTSTSKAIRHRKNNTLRLPAALRLHGPTVM